MTEKKHKHKRLNAQQWDEVRDAYVQGVFDNDGNRSYPTLEALAESYDVHITTVHRHSKDEGWLEQRAVFQGKLQQEVDNEKRKYLSQEAVEFDVNSLKIAKALQSDIIRLMRMSNKDRADYEDQIDAWMQRKINALANDEDFTEPKPGLPKLFSASGLVQLSSALEKTQRAGRLALGQSTENQNVSGNVTTADAGLNEAFEIVRKLSAATESGSDSLH